MPSRILSSCSRSSGRSRSVSKAVSSGPSSGGIALDVLAQRPFGTSSFALIVVVGLAAAIARVFIRIRPLVVVPAVALLSFVYSMTLVLPSRRPWLVGRGPRPLRHAAPRRRLRHGCRRARRPARRRHPRPLRRGRAGRLVSGYGYLDGHRAPARPLSRFLVFALAVIVSVGGLTRPALLPPGRQWRPVRRPVRGQPDRARGDPVEPRPDLRPRGQRPRHERADVRGQDPAGRPARGPARRGRHPALGADRRWPSSTSTSAIDGNPGSRFDARARRPGRPEGDGEPDRRGGRRAAGRRGRRRGPPPVHRRARSSRRSSATRARCPRTSSRT